MSRRRSLDPGIDRQGIYLCSCKSRSLDLAFDSGRRSPLGSCKSRSLDPDIDQTDTLWQGHKSNSKSWDLGLDQQGMVGDNSVEVCRYTASYPKSRLPHTLYCRLEYLPLEQNHVSHCGSRASTLGR
jgi:hypothetical protein